MVALAILFFLPLLSTFFFLLLILITSFHSPPSSYSFPFLVTFLFSSYSFPDRVQFLTAYGLAAKTKGESLVHEWSQCLPRKTERGETLNKWARFAHTFFIMYNKWQFFAQCSELQHRGQSCKKLEALNMLFHSRASPVLDKVMRGGDSLVSHFM